MANEMILVVDADKKSQKVLEVCFKKAGYRVVVADSVAQAMRHVQQTRPSLIVSDTVLADGDGLEFCADLKHNPEYKDIPFVFLTEDRSLPQKMRGFELGADDYLTKPIYIKEVTTRVDLLLQKRAKELNSDAEGDDFEGNLSDITMIDLLQNIESQRVSGSVLITRGTRQAIVYFRDGNLLDAVCGKLQGEDAIYRVMMWPEGGFVVRYHDHMRRVDHIEKSTDAVLLEGIHRLDEWNSLVAELPAMHHVFAVNYQEVSGQIDEFPGEVEQVVRLFDGHRTLYDVVDDSPLEDIVTLHIIGKLLEDQMLNDVTPIEVAPATMKNTMLDASGLNAWLSSSELRDTNPGHPFRQLENEIEDAQSERASRETADEVATVDLRRPRDERGVEEKEESGTGGGHWKFHWSEDGAADLKYDSTDEDDSVNSPNSPNSAGLVGNDAVRAGESVDDKWEQGLASQVSDSLREVEARETIRRAEEARRLAEQMRHIDSNASSKQLRSVPVSVDAETDVAVAQTDDVGESAVSGVDSTQELFIQPLLDSANAGLEEEITARSRANTPLSTPAQLIRAGLGDLVDGQWNTFEEDAEDGEIGDQISEPVKAALDAVEAREPVFVADETHVETVVSAAESESVLGTDGSAESVDRQETREGEETVQQELHVRRSERTTLPLNMVGFAVAEESAGETSVGEESSELEGAGEEKSVEDDSAEQAGSLEEKSEEETSLVDDGLNQSVAATSIEEDTSPEEDVAQEQRVASAFESVEEFEAPLFDAVEPCTTSLQSPKEGEVVRSTFDLKKSGLRNIRGLGPADAGEKSSVTEKSANKSDAGEESAAVVDSDAQASKAVESDGDAETAADKVAGTSKSASKSRYETAEIALPKLTSVTDSAEEDSFFSAADDSFDEFDEPRAASNNWKMPVLIVGILALIVVLTWNGMKSSESEKTGEDAAAGQVAQAPVAPVVEEKPAEVEPIAEVAEAAEVDEAMEEGAGLDEDQALAQAVVDGEAVEDSAREVSEEIRNGAVEASEELAAEDHGAVEGSGEGEEEKPVEVAEVAPKPAPVVKEKPVAAAKAPVTFDGKVVELRNMIKRERTADALKLARTLSAEAPTDRSVAFLHGQAALYERQNKEAIENLARAEKLGMRTSALYLELGQAYQLAGQRDRAKQSYEEFLKIQPSGRSADEVRSILKNQF